MEWYIPGCTGPTQATACFVIVFVSRIQKSCTGDNNFAKWKGIFRSDRPKWPDRSKWTAFKAGPEYCGRTKPNWSVPFDVPTEISGILGWTESAPRNRTLTFPQRRPRTNGLCQSLLLSLNQPQRRHWEQSQRIFHLLSLCFHVLSASKLFSPRHQCALGSLLAGYHLLNHFT